MTQTFKAKEQLSAVRLYVDLYRTDGDIPFNLMTNFPKQVFTDEDMEKPLQELGKTQPIWLFIEKNLPNKVIFYDFRFSSYCCFNYGSKSLKIVHWKNILVITYIVIVFSFVFLLIKLFSKMVFPIFVHLFLYFELEKFCLHTLKYN